MIDERAPDSVHTRNALHHLPGCWKAPAHVRAEHSTCTWQLESMLERAGFDLRDAWYSESRPYARDVCGKR